MSSIVPAWAEGCPKPKITAPPVDSSQDTVIDQNTFKKLLIKNLIVPLCVVITLAGIVIAQMFYLVSVSRSIDKEERNIARANELFRLLVDAETGVRGFQLTGRDHFLEPLVESESARLSKFVNLRELVKDHAAQAKRLDEIGADFDQWAVQARWMIEMKKKNIADYDFETAEAANAIFSEVRLEFAEFLELATRIRKEKSKNAEKMIYLSLAMILVLCGSAGVFLAYYQRIQIVHLSTDYSKAYNAIKRVNEELEAFSYSVSHDLRAPLRGIDGFSLALLEGAAPKLSEQEKKYLNFIRENVQKMGALIDGLLSLSRLTRSSLKVQEVNITEISNEIIKDLRRQEPDRIVEVKIQPGLIVSGDRELLRAVMDNLIRNAWKFTAKRSSGKIEVGSFQQGERKVFFVRDNGAGFNMEYAKKLFGAFQRLHSQSEFSGFGIGLATVRRIILRHNGEVWAEGKENEGASFYFTI